MLGAIVLAGAAAEAGTRVVRPRVAPIEPAPIDVREYFSEQEIERGRHYARPQLALSLARGAVELGALAALVRHRPKALAALGRRPVAGGAVAGAGLAVGLSVPPLPLAAISRVRAMRVGLVTQSWRSWAVDIAKGTAIETGLAAAGGAAVLAATRRWPRNWWLPLSGGAIVFGDLRGAHAGGARSGVQLLHAAPRWRNP